MSSQTTKRSHWLKWLSALRLLSFSLLPVLTAAPAYSAERINLSYGIVQRSISVDSLETYAKTGQINDDLAAYVEDLNPSQLAQLRQALLTRIPLSAVEVSQFLYTPIGESLLERIGVVIQTEAPQSRFYAIRSALILAAADPEGFTLLNVLRQFPLEEININLSRSLAIAEAVQLLVNQTQQAIAEINQASTLQASTAPLTPLPASANLWQPGEFAWEMRTIILNDQSRDRRFPVDIYLPLTSVPRPVVVISHGLGSDRFSFAYLAEHLASRGFVVAVPEHPGSSAEQLQALLAGRAAEVTSPSEFIDRPLDVKFLLNELDRLSQNNPAFQGRLNLQQVGIVGQSFGGYTALALAGATLNLEQLEADCQTLETSLNLSLLFQCLALRLSPQAEYNLSDPRIKAVIAISPVDSSILGQAGLSQIDIPVMIIAGSADTVTPPLLEQIQPFTWLTSPNKYLVLINGGTHFSALESSPDPAIVIPSQAIGPAPALARQYVQALNTAFFYTYIADDSSYRPYLSAAYAEAISQEPLPLSLVQSLLELQVVDEESNRRTTNG